MTPAPRDEAQNYRTLDDMTQQERDALCALYGTTISTKREPYEDAPWRLSDSFDGKRQEIEGVIACPHISHFVRKACVKLLNSIDLRGYLSAHQKAQLRRWRKKADQLEVAARVRSEAEGKASVAGSLRAPFTPTTAAKPIASRKRCAKPKKKVRA